MQARLLREVGPGHDIVSGGGAAGCAGRGGIDVKRRNGADVGGGAGDSSPGSVGAGAGGIGGASRAVGKSIVVAGEGKFAGSRAYRGSDVAEYTATLDQPIEVGGKRGLRQDLARAALQRAELDLTVRRGALVAEARRRYVAVQLAQAQQDNARERLVTSQRAAEVVRTKRGAGVAAGLDDVRTQVAVSLATIEVQKTTEHLAQARAQLVRLWEGNVAEANEPLPALVLPPALADAAAMLGQLQQGPRWQLAESWRATQQYQAALARSAAWPDVTLKVGHRWFEEGDDHAWIVGLSIPFPVWDRNQGGIRASREGTLRVDAEVAAARRALRENFAMSVARVRIAHETASRLENETLPLAKRSYALVEEGYRLGRHELLYLLEAQQTLFAVEAGVLDALGELHFALADLDELLGPPDAAMP